MTDEQGTLTGGAPVDAAGDPEIVRRDRAIAARLAIPRPRRDLAVRRGAGELVSVRYRGGSDDIDLDRTVGASGSAPPRPRSARWPAS